MLEQPAFGNRLRALRLERGLSQAAIAEGGLSTGYLSRLESGMRQPNNRIVAHIAKRLGVPVSAFDEAQMLSSLSEALAIAASAPEGDDVVEILTQALHTDDNRNPVLRWQALWLLSRIRADRGERSEEHVLLLELVGLSDKLGSRELGARTRARLSRSVQAMGDHARAREYAEEAHRMSAGLSLADKSEALHALISAEAETSQLTGARAHARELCALTESAGGILHVKALWASATVCIRQADYAEAQQVLERALKGLDSHTDLMLWIQLRLAAASLYVQITPRQTEQARTMLDDIEPVIDLVGTDLHNQQNLTLQAHLAFAEGRIPDARALSEQIDEQTTRLSDRDRVRFQALRSKLRILDGHFEEGTRELRQLAEQAQAVPNAELAAEIWRDLAETLAGAYGRGGRADQA
ncbi:MAG TPA: transcriptional regulator [Micromonosporaceae bacterium]|nr:transcriptional regulator [Micromonosporaceae bacterium]